MAAVTDYDSDPARFSLVAVCGLAGDSHERVARRLIAERPGLLLDIGCGRGRLAADVSDGSRWVGLDSSPSQLRQCPARPVTAGDATRLPFQDNTFGAATALWLLYHLPDPQQALREVRRVLRPGGLFIACTDSREDAGELLYPRPASSFDAEDAPEIVASVFGDAEVEPWSVQIGLESEQAIEEFLRGMQISSALRRDRHPPLTVTKSGYILYSRR